MPTKDNWNPVVISPLSLMLDSRSRPADQTPGSFRYKLNLAVNRTGGLTVQSGFSALDFGLRSDNPSLVANWDFHRRGGPREPVTFLYEATATDGKRHLFAGTQSSLSFLDNGTSEWTTVISGGTDFRWSAGTVNDNVIFTTGTDVAPDHLIRFRLDTMALQVGFTNLPVTKARVSINFSGFILLMQGSTVYWSDSNVGYDFTNIAPSVGGFRDLDAGDTILNAVEMMGALYIFTVRAIWRCTLNPNTDPTTPTLLFDRIYSEPLNQTGCLVYPNTLVTTGRDLYWWSHDSVWTFNPYIVSPESTEWLLKGSGAQFSTDNVDRAEKRCCETIVGCYRPLTREIRYSYPQATGSASAVCVNNRELVLNTEFHTMHLSDAGFSAYCNFRQTPELTENCNAGQVFIGASTTDDCLKSFEEVFSREFVTLIGGDRGADIPDVQYATYLAGYYCRLVGLAPFGYPDKEKIVRDLYLDHDIKANTLALPNLLTLRIGNHYNLVDPMALEAYCAPQWQTMENVPLVCPDTAAIQTMLDEGTRPSDPLGWTIWETGNRLYFDLRITANDGSAPLQHDCAFSAMRFSVALV